MNIHHKALGNLQFLTLSGRIDGYSLAHIEKQFIHAIARGNPPEIIVNMQQVDFMDSAALAFLIKIEKRCAASDGKMILVGIPPQVLQIFRLTNLEHYFSICDTEQRAMLAIRNQKQVTGWGRTF